MLGTLSAVSTEPLTGRDAVVAIVGGTMLTLALTRPLLRWPSTITAGHRVSRLWLERLVTAFCFAMGGYAATAVLIVLYHQLGREVDGLLKGATYFFISYGLVVHYEPFVGERRLGRGMTPVALYLALVGPAVIAGAVFAEWMLRSKPPGFSDWAALTTVIAIGLAVWLLYYCRQWRWRVELRTSRSCIEIKLSRVPAAWYCMPASTPRATRTPARSTPASRQAARR